MNLDKLIKEYPWSVKTIRCKGTTYTAVEWVGLSIKYETAIELAKHVGCGNNAITNQNKKFTELDGFSGKLVTKFLRVLGLKKCSDCSQIKEPKSYSKNKNAPDGLCDQCKECRAAYTNSEAGKLTRKRYNQSEARKLSTKRYAQSDKGIATKRANTAKRRASKLQRTPAWSDLEAIAIFYLNCPEGYQVDHIIPLQGELVSGLHVLENLQYLIASENRSKSNKYEV